MTETKNSKMLDEGGKSVVALMAALMAAIFAFQLNASMLSPALTTMRVELNTTDAQIGLTQTVFFTSCAVFSLFLPQDTINALSDFLGFFHFLFQCKIPLIKRFPLGGQLGVFFFPCLCRDCGLAVHHAFEIIFRCCE